MCAPAFVRRQNSVKITTLKRRATPFIGAFRLFVDGAQWGGVCLPAPPRNALG